MSQAVLTFVALALVGCVCLFAGVLILAGIGWGLIVLAVEFFVSAAFLKLGMNVTPRNEIS